MDAGSEQPELTNARAMYFDGVWQLTADRALELAVHQTGRASRQTLSLRGAVIRADAHALVFALRQQEQGERETQRLTLFGRWQADARNQLTFLADTTDGPESRLTLQGGWELGDRHELLYRYRQKAGAPERIVVFDGAWDVAQAQRLAYRLSGSTDSVFEFRASLQSRALQARDGRLVYQVGIAVSRQRTIQRRIALFGTWKLNRDLSVSFEVPYADGRIQAIRFEAAASLSPRDRLVVALRDRRGEPMGLTVTFTRELVPDASLFLRLRRDAEERSVIGGVQVRF